MRLFEVELKLKGLTLIYVPSRNQYEPPEPTEVKATCMAYIDVVAETEEEAKRLAIEYAYGDDRGLREVQSVEYSSIWEYQKPSALVARYTEPE